MRAPQNSLPVRGDRLPGPAGLAGEPPAPLSQIWRGASAKPYRCVVHSLLTCPRMVDALYILVRVREDGVRSVLHIARTRHRHGSLNLAEVRHLGAKLGASEIHIHLGGASDDERRVIENDLRHGQPVEAERTVSLH